ncbi:hypothetical protein [Nocardia barduliensis]|uniref:hypothetical protein n=1 Tax=Nocardia barduliensis TaxID=2736643 RepID=UPI0015737C57|nr:hypothetical protein [Nocardia barduliensis]
MGKGRNLIGPANLVWVLVAGVGAVLFVAAVVSLGVRLGMRSGLEAAAILALPVSVVLGMVLWTQVLGVVWRLRRAYLRRSGTAVPAAVVDTSYRRLNRINGFDQHRVRIEVTFGHPETGVEHLLRKEYVFSEFRRRRATSLQADFPEGASMTALVRGRSAAFDLPVRPAWADIW